MFGTQRVQCVIDLLQSALGFPFLSHLPVGLALKPRLSLSASASASVHHTNPKPKIPSIQTLFQLLSQRDRERERPNLQFNSNSTQVRTSPSFLFSIFLFPQFKKTKKNCFTSISRFILETLDSLLDLVCLAVENMQERNNFFFLSLLVCFLLCL